MHTANNVISRPLIDRGGRFQLNNNFSCRPSSKNTWLHCPNRKATAHRIDTITLELVTILFLYRNALVIGHYFGMLYSSLKLLKMHGMGRLFIAFSFGRWLRVCQWMASFIASSCAATIDVIGVYSSNALFLSFSLWSCGSIKITTMNWPKRLNNQKKAAYMHWKWCWFLSGFHLFLPKSATICQHRFHNNKNQIIQPVSVFFFFEVFFTTFCVHKLWMISLLWQDYEWILRTHILCIACEKIVTHLDASCYLGENWYG